MLDRDAVGAVLFDLDGTLMDTDDQTVERLAARLQRLGCPRPYRIARSVVMAAETPLNLLMTLLDVVGLDAPLMRQIGRLRGSCQLSTGPDLHIVPGVKEMLTQLNRRYRLAVVTTRGSDDAEAFLAQHGLRDLFDAIVTRESTGRLKPHGDPVRHAARLLDVPVDRCVMVGDTTVDVASARRAGARAVAVLCGFGERRELEGAGAQVVLEHTAELPSVL